MDIPRCFEPPSLAFPYCLGLQLRISRVHPQSAVAMSPIVATAASVITPAAKDYKRESGTARLLGSGKDSALLEIAKIDASQAPLASPSCLSSTLYVQIQTQQKQI